MDPTLQDSLASQTTNLHLPALMTRRTAAREVIAKVEKVFDSIVEGLLCNGDEIYITIKSNRSSTASSSDHHSGQMQAAKFCTVRFPGRTPHEAWKFTVLFRILEFVHEALTSNVVFSKRLHGFEDTTFLDENIYYKDPSLFKSQGVVDRLVDDLAFTFNVPRAALNITAAAKGLVAGDFSMRRLDGTIIQRHSELTAMLIDDVHEIGAVDVSGVGWVLLIEKESTFRTLASNRYHQASHAGKGIIITAKGYPDLSTRAFLRLLSVSWSEDKSPLPIYALVDFDPDGIAIMSTYKHGSASMPHENARLIVPCISWLGLRSADLYDNEAADESKGLLRLTIRDRKKAMMMLENKIMIDEGPEAEWRRELQVMLILNMKAEMELLSEREGGLESWLDRELLTRKQ